MIVMTPGIATMMIHMSWTRRTEMGWTDLDPKDVTPHGAHSEGCGCVVGELIELVYTSDSEIINYLSDEGLADWVTVEDESDEG